MLLKKSILFREFAQIGGGVLAYGLILFVLSIICAGAGDGTYVPFRIFSAPFGLIAFSAGLYGVPLLWLLAGGLLIASRARHFRTAFIILMICHYVGTIVVAATTPNARWSRFFELSQTISPGAFMAAAFAIYVLGQFLLWKCFYRRHERVMNSSQGPDG